jgi:stress response protein YsnF
VSRETTKKRAAIPIIEEKPRVDRRRVQAGKVQVKTIVDSVKEIVEDTLLEESVGVTRVPVGKEIGKPPKIRSQGDTLIVPVVEEVMVIEKRLILKEEIHIRRKMASHRVALPVTLRKQRAVITRKAKSDEITGGRSKREPN